MNPDVNTNGGRRAAEVTIRPVATVDEMSQLETVQRTLWPDDAQRVLPVPWMLAIARNGGLVLGAFDGERAVGFLVGFLGTDQPAGARPAMADLKHVSAQIGVLPSYQGQGVGFRLKLAQRDFVARQGVRLVTWTFDPLDSRHAYFNMRKLGAVTRRYLRDYDPAQGDAPADRIGAEWWVNSRRVERRLSGERAGLTLNYYASARVPILNPTTPGRDGFARPANVVAGVESLDHVVVLVEIPHNFPALRAADPALAGAWRHHVREVLEPVLAAGYISTDFVYENVEGRLRSFYVLSQGNATL